MTLRLNLRQPSRTDNVQKERTPIGFKAKFGCKIFPFYEQELILKYFFGQISTVSGTTSVKS